MNYKKFVYRLWPGMFLIAIKENGKASAMNLTYPEAKAAIEAIDSINGGKNKPVLIKSPNDDETMEPPSKKKLLPRTLTPEHWSEIMKLREDGVSWKKVAEIIGVSYDSLLKFNGRMSKQGITLEMLASGQGQ